MIQFLYRLFKSDISHEEASKISQHYTEEPQDLKQYRIVEEQEEGYSNNNYYKNTWYFIEKNSPLGYQKLKVNIGDSGKPRKLTIYFKDKDIAIDFLNKYHLYEPVHYKGYKFIQVFNTNTNYIRNINYIKNVGWLNETERTKILNKMEKEPSYLDSFYQKESEKQFCSFLPGLLQQIDKKNSKPIIKIKYLPIKTWQ